MSVLSFWFNLNISTEKYISNYPKPRPPGQAQAQAKLKPSHWAWLRVSVSPCPGFQAQAWHIISGDVYHQEKITIQLCPV
jgi:hypothetical protein